MTKRIPAIAGLALIIALISPAADAQVLTPCDRTALKAFRACSIDTHEEFILTMANCLQIGDANEREACKEEAGEIRDEDKEECEEVREARHDLCELLGEFRYDPDPLLDPANAFVDPAEIPGVWAANPLLSLEEGRISVLGAEDEVVVILNTDDTREFHGVECRVVAEVAFEIEEDGGEIEYTPVELTFDYFAQTEAGHIIYCGENTVEYEDGYPVSTDGTFLAGEEFAKSGYLVRANPVVGEADRQEFFLDDAEDWVMYLDLAATPPGDVGGEVDGFECAGGCVQTVEGQPIEPDAIEWKFYLPDVGFVLAIPFELNDDDEWEWTGEREELICLGGSLDILESADCDIDDPEGLLEVLCGIAGDSFCD